MIEDLTARLIRLCVKPGMTCVDVGANIGDATEVMLECGAGKIIAIEPLSGFRDVLRSRFPDVELHTVAINAARSRFGKNSQWYVMRDPTNEGNAGITDDCRGEPVEFSTLDQVIAGRTVDFIKIDVEGMELEVIQGATETINSCRPSILFETLYPFQEAVKEPIFERIFGFLEGYRYQLWSLRDGSLVKACVNNLDHDTLAIPVSGE